MGAGKGAQRRPGRGGRAAECTRLESEQTVKGLGSSNLPLSATRRSSFVVAAVCALATLPLSNAPVAGQTSDSTSVRGRVTDLSGAPLADFPVLVIDSEGRAVELRSGRDGRFVTIGLSFGPLTVELDAQDFAPASVRCRVPIGETAVVDLVGSRNRRASLPLARCRVEPPTTDLYVID